MLISSEKECIREALMAEGFLLPKNLERYFAALSKIYSKDGSRTKHEILVNAQVMIHENSHYESWNGGVYGHTLSLMLPDYLYLNVIHEKEAIQNEIQADINAIHHIPDEYIARVFLEMEIQEDQDWRKQSGLFRSRRRVVLPESEKRIWGKEGFRLFLSHKSEVKTQTGELKERLAVLGVSAFVAHDDIHPTQEWQDEIENALASMDGFAALLTEGFHNSNWTDQEVGYALARGVPMIAVRLGTDPYGFIGRFQALTTTWDECSVHLVRVLIKYERMLAAYIEAMRRCVSWDNGNILAKVLPSLDRLSQQQLDDLVAAYNGSIELQGSFGFNGGWGKQHGPGLVSHLNRLGKRRYKYGSTRMIEIA